MNGKIQTALRLALEAKRVMDLIDIEVHRTRRGHWRPPAVAWSRRCPMSDPRTALAFDRQLRRLLAARLLLAAEQPGRPDVTGTRGGAFAEAASHHQGMTMVGCWYDYEASRELAGRTGRAGSRGRARR